MLGSIKRKIALATASGALVMAGSALAASPALAYHINYGNGGGGGAVPVGTSYSASSTAIGFTTPSTGGSVAACTSSSLSGTTINSSGGTGSGVSAGLSATGGSFGGCTITSTGTNITVTGNFSPAWEIFPTSGTSSPFNGEVLNVNVTVVCLGNTLVYKGNLTTNATETNANPSYISLNNSGSLTRTSGSGCAAIPTTVGVTGRYTLATVAGAAVNSTNDFWLENN